MKILLIGEYSNVHWTLAQGLRNLGYDVTVASSGDRFKNFDRDINLHRNSYSKRDSFRYIYQVFRNFRTFKGYDIVQIINPFFLDLKADRNLEAFLYLKKHNGAVVMGAFGDDVYWLKACLDGTTFRYSEFDIPGRDTHLKSAEKLIEVWSDKEKIRVNQKIAEMSDAIIAGLYEYYVSYLKDFSTKLTYISVPINTSEIGFRERVGDSSDTIRFFIGVQKKRSEIKGTDRMYEALMEIHNKYKNECQIIKVESVPYHQYIGLMDQGDVLLDQLYSYSPSMNALTAMAKGLVAISGGEPEMYDLLGETKNHPIVNVVPDSGDIYKKLETIIKNKSLIQQQSLMSRSFVEDHHNYLKIAKQFVSVWSNLS